MSKKTLLLIFALLTFVFGAFAQPAPMRLENGRFVGPDTPGYQTQRRQALFMWAYKVDAPCEAIKIRAISNVSKDVNLDSRKIARFDVEETFTPVNGSSHAPNKYSFENKLEGEGEILVYSLDVPCNQPDGRFDYKVTAISQRGRATGTNEVIRDEFNVKVEPAEMTVNVGNTPTQFGRPNRQLIVASSEITPDGWLKLTGLFSKGAWYNIVIGRPPMKGYVVQSTSYDYRHLWYYIGDLKDLDAGMVVVQAVWGGESAARFLQPQQ